MAFLTWLPGVLKAAGVPYIIMPGAETRTTRASGLVVNGIVWHHTATSKGWLDSAVDRLLRNGRPDLRGPLSQVGVPRDGVWHIEALGRCNHNGFGEWGNDSLGLEFFNDGVGEPFTAAQMKYGKLGTAAVLRHLSLSPAQIKGHKETNPGRKIDPLAVNMALVRSEVGRMLADKPAPPTQETPDMASESFFAQRGINPQVWYFEQGRYTYIADRDDLNALAKAAGISNQEAELSEPGFDALAKGRERIVL